MMDGAAPPRLRPLRPPSQVMRLARMGQMMPNRLSFLRVLMRNLAEIGTPPERRVWDIDADGYGQAVYTLTLGGYTYSLVVFTRPLADENRSDRVIATAWDAAFVLYDGVPDAGELARLAENVPRQEAGTFTARELVLSRANKSVRLFADVVASLRAGRAPDADLLAATGYLMRTTAVYGNGKFGIADRADISARPGLGGPFMAEMLAVWLMRGFTHDLVEHVGGAPLDRGLKRQLGVGNATGLGMAPFLVSHPLLLDAWFQVRETALARVLSQTSISEAEATALIAAAEQARLHLVSWHVQDTEANAVIRQTERQWTAFCAELTVGDLRAEGGLARAFDGLSGQGETLEELAAAWVIEPFGDLVDGLAECLATPFRPVLDPSMTCAALRRVLEAHGDWAITLDFSQPGAVAQFWYVSEDKLEPRLGQRATEPGAERETPLDTARQFAALYAACPDDETPLWQFLAAAPEHRSAARRAQTLVRHPYAEVRDNLLDAATAPVDLLRAKLSMFGATRFDPKSRLWTRVTLAQGLPLFDELDRPADWLPCPVHTPVHAAP